MLNKSSNHVKNVESEICCSAHEKFAVKSGGNYIKITFTCTRM